LETFHVSIKQPTHGQSREGGQGDFEGRLREFWTCLIDPCNISTNPSAETSTEVKELSATFIPWKQLAEYACQSFVDVHAELLSEFISAARTGVDLSGK
jgi:hypothetical protein